MKTDPSRQRRLDILAQGDRLNRVAYARTGDANEGRLIVHAVIARALDDQRLPTTIHGMDDALHAALSAWRPAGSRA